MLELTLRVRICLASSRVSARGAGMYRVGTIPASRGGKAVPRYLAVLDVAANVAQVPVAT